MASIKFGPGISPAELARRQARYTRLILQEERSRLRISARETRELNRQIEKDFRASERARKRELAAFKRFAKRFKVQIKRPGHGLKKQLKEYRPRLERYRELEADRLGRPREAFRATAEAYAEKLDEVAQKHPGNVENPGDLFLSLPIKDQRRIMREAEALHQEWVMNGHKDLGRNYDPLIIYH